MLLEFSWGESEETSETTESRGSPAALTRCRALPGPGRARRPAGSALSAGATPAAAPSRPGPAPGDRFPPHLPSSGVWDSRAEPAVVSTRKLVTKSRRVRRLGRAPHSGVREAASPRKGALTGASSNPSVPLLTLCPGARQRDPRDPSTLRRPSRTSAELESRSPDACAGTGHSGAAPPFPGMPPTAPTLLTCPGGAHTEPHN